MFFNKGSLKTTCSSQINTYLAHLQYIKNHQKDVTKFKTIRDSNTIKNLFLPMFVSFSKLKQHKVNTVTLFQISLFKQIF